MQDHKVYDSGGGNSNGFQGVGFSDKALLVSSLVGFLSIGLAMYIFVFRNLSNKNNEYDDDQDDNDNYEEMLDQADVATLNRAQRRARAKNRMKRSRRLPPPTHTQQADGNDDDGQHNENENHQPADGGIDDSVDRPLSRKERQAAAKALERKERRRYEEQRRKELLLHEKEQQEALEEKREKRRKKLQAEEAERKKREYEIQKQQQEKYLAWKYMFYKSTTPEENNDNENEIDILDSNCLVTVKEFRDCMKRCKVMHLKQMAEMLYASPVMVQSRVEKLVLAERLTGLWDNNHFVYLSPQELRAVRDFVAIKGRVSPEDLSDCSSELLNLKTAQHCHHD